MKLKPRKHKIDLQLLPTDIIKNISKHLIKNDDFRLNEIMHCKIDIGLTNFFFPGNLKINKYLCSYLGPNKETQFYNYKNYEGLTQYKNILNMRYALRESEDVVSYFKINFTFHGWKEFDERDKYKEMFEARYTQPSYDIYIESYDKNDELLSKINYNDIQDTMHDYRVCAPLGGLCGVVNKYLKEITNFKLLE